MAAGKRKGWGICLSVCGVILVTLGFVFWLIFGAVIASMLKSGNFITSEDSDLFADWECTFRSDDPDPPFAFETFYVFNMTNPNEVLQGAVPIYDERGPFTYRANYTKFKISFLENDIVEYKRQKAFYFDAERSSGPDTEMIININPGYLGAVAATGSETLLLLVLVGPSVESLLKRIQVDYIENVLIANEGFDHWLEICQGIDPDCETTMDMAMVQWGYFSIVPNRLGLDGTDVNTALPAQFQFPEAEYSLFVKNSELPKPGTEMTIARTKMLLYGEKGIVNDPANFEYLAGSLGNEEELAVWGLDGGRGLLFLRYSNSLVDTYTTEFHQSVVAQGSGFLRWRTVWQVLWEDIDPLLMVLQPWEPYANIFWNYTTMEMADEMTGFYRINNGETDHTLVEEMVMWEGYEVVDWFWENNNITVTGNSGNGQFPYIPLSWTGTTPKILEDIAAWSSDHGRAVIFRDNGEKVDLYGIKTHLYAMIHDTYLPDTQYDNYLGDYGYGFVNATSINDGTPVWYSQPRFYLVDQKWKDWALGIPEATELDNSFVWLEPVTGLALKAEVKLQVNFYVHNNTDPLFDKFYPNVPTGIFYPLTWTQQDGYLKEADAVDLQEQLFNLIGAARIVWIIVFVLGGLVFLGGVFLIVTAPKPGYEPIN